MLPKLSSECQKSPESEIKLSIHSLFRVFLLPTVSREGATCQTAAFPPQFCAFSSVSLVWDSRMWEVKPDFKDTWSIQLINQLSQNSALTYDIWSTFDVTQPSAICCHYDHFCQWCSRPPKWLLLSVLIHILWLLATLVVLYKTFRYNNGDWAGFEAFCVSNAPFWLMACQCARSHHILLALMR